MGWFGWLKRGPAVRHPRLVVELVGGSRVVMTADWPHLRTDEEKAGMGQTMAAMLFYLHDGQLLAQVQQAVGVAGHVKGDPRLAAHVLECLNRMFAENGGGERDGPVIAPDEVFEKG